MGILFRKFLRLGSEIRFVHLESIVTTLIKICPTKYSYYDKIKGKEEETLCCYPKVGKQSHLTSHLISKMKLLVIETLTHQHC